MSNYEPTVFGGALPPGVEPTPDANKPARVYLTKRELFAAMAMQGLCAQGCTETRAFQAVAWADALLKELGK